MCTMKRKTTRFINDWRRFDLFKVFYSKIYWYCMQMNENEGFTISRNMSENNKQKQFQVTQITY